MENINLNGFLLRSIDQTPDKVYLQFKDQRITYEEQHQRIIQSARGFLDIGIRKEDKVCVMMSNSPEYLDVWFGLSWIGAILVPINVHLKGEGLQYILSHSDCKAIVVDYQYMNRISSCQIPKEIQIIIRGQDVDAIKPSNVRLEDLLASNDQYLPNVNLSPDSINSILYTSGTTGPPKGVMLSHSAYVNSAKAFVERMIGARKEDILFTSLPLFHINAQAHTALGSIYSNATMALSERFSASRFWDEIRYHGATIFNSLGSMIPILCKQPQKEDDPHNPARVTACAATPKEFWRQFEERFGIEIVEGYGLTETTGFCISNPLKDRRIGSIGKPFPYIETKVVDERGKRLKAGKEGEILIKPLKKHVLMERYYKMSGQTMMDGWFHTGDLGYEDEDGFLYFSDRLKQCIRRRGENISSWEVEKVINDHPKVLESAVVPVPSEVGEDDVKAYIVLKKGEDLPYKEIIKWCEERMAYFMVPRYVQYVESFPKTATERIQKFKLEKEGIGDAWDREKVDHR